MRTKEFNVPAEAIIEFAELLEENEIENSILGVTENQEIQIEIKYDRHQRNGVMELLELVENYVEGSEQEEEEQEEE